MPFKLPPTFSIIALIFYYNENIDDVILIFNIIYTQSVPGALELQAEFIISIVLAHVSHRSSRSA